MPTEMSQERRAWLARIVISLAGALGVGVLAYLVTRAITGARLFIQHQQLVREASSALRGGIDGLAGSNLRAVRQMLEQLDAQNQQISLLAGFLAAAVAVAGIYLWLEWRAQPRES
jgi:hypothetical protein